MPIYRFAGCELDPAERRLIAHGHPVTLTPKVFDTLVLLVEHAGRVVSKDELMAALWPRGFVHESNLTKHIWLIRKALGDSEHDARCIETVPKLGYRFIAPVEAGARIDMPVHVAAAPASAPATDAAPVRAEAVEHGAAPHALGRRRAYRAALAVAALIAFIALAWRFTRREDAAMPPRAGTAVAIVDFNNLSQNAKDAWLGPALVEMLGAEMALGDHVFVLPDEIVRPAQLGIYLSETRNDLEAAAVELVPAIGALTQALGKAPGCVLARMSGSGASVFGLFGSSAQAHQAAHDLRAQWPGYWVAAAPLVG